MVGRTSGTRLPLEQPNERLDKEQHVTKRMTQIVVIGAFAALLAIGAGAAIAGGGFADQQTFLNDVAQRLNVTPEQLKAALKGASDDQIDAAVAAGKITKAQGDAMKQRAAQGGMPFFGGGHHGGFGHHGAVSMTAVAGYLGLTEAELHTQLESGKTLAQLAKDNGKTVDGLERTITGEAKKSLDAAVTAGTITQAQADAMLTQLTAHVGDMVNGTGRMHGDGDGDHGFGGPPPGMEPNGMQPNGMQGGMQGSGTF
jgi:hypothetical protein